MRLAALVPPLIVVAGGIYTYSRPMKMRSFVSAQAWEEKPQTAKRRHRERAQNWGLGLIAFGLFWLLAALVP
ncbi:hypothetical protein GJR96_04020 [Haloferax sp. MBLA0076]|uniref:Uncharacterized protein n=1 Tax=Haloferax litoreum TaxID=2666140 RepID=A0A6A8GD77_9EURY|nr:MULTISPECIES: hypothetical protein [Haloferax]KAB1192648.1 hypothetical protein Hfx1148_04010 [Haloferax sp. CBA1148]MRX21123.1 hypothetical protein [Haloferax litoreum]